MRDTGGHGPGVQGRSEAASSQTLAHASNTGHALWLAYRQQRDPELLRAAGQTLRAALALDEAAAWWGRHLLLGNLANVERSVYHDSGDLAALHRAIALTQEAIAACPEGDADRAPWRGNLAHCLRDLAAHDAQSGWEHISGSLQALHDVVQAAPVGTPEHLVALANRALAGSDALRTLGPFGAEHAHLFLLDALRARRFLPPGHEAEGAVASACASAHVAASEAEASPAAAARHLDEAVRSYESLHERSRGALGLTDHLGLASTLLARWRRFPDPATLARGVDAFRSVAKASSGDGGSRSVCVRAARTWGDWASERGAWEEALEAYDYGLSAVRDVLVTQAERRHQEQWLLPAEGLPARAAHAAHRAAKPAAAVVAILEEGRTRLLDDALSRPATSRTSHGDAAHGVVDAAEVSEVVVHLASGPGTGLACLVRAGGASEALDVPGLDSEEVRRLATAVMQSDVTSRKGLVDEAGAFLWSTVVETLSKHLTPQEALVCVPGGLLGALPLHTAWTSDPGRPTGRRYLLDEHLVTYTPSARLLAAARSAAAVRDVRDVLAVDEPSSGGVTALPCSADEAAFATARFSEALSLRGDDATVRAVLDRLVGASVVHLSCHGRAEAERPLDSALHLADDRLTVARLLPLDLRATGRTRLAFLSACETAVLGRALPDEAVSLPTALMHVGIPGVVATGWSVRGSVAALVVLRFYETWLSADGVQQTSPAQALRRAVTWVRDSTDDEKLAAVDDAYADAHGADGGLWQALALAADEDRDLSAPVHWGAFSYVGA